MCRGPGSPEAAECLKPSRNLCFSVGLRAAPFHMTWVGLGLSSSALRVRQAWACVQAPPGAVQTPALCSMGDHRQWPLHLHTQSPQGSRQACRTCDKH